VSAAAREQQGSCNTGYSAEISTSSFALIVTCTT